MLLTEPVSEEAVVDLARECLYRFLAATLTDPLAPGWHLLEDEDSLRTACEAADLLRTVAGFTPPAFGELPPDRLDVEPLLAELARSGEELRAEYDRVFGLVPARECPPYETEYHPTAEPFFRSQQLADVAGFYRAFGLEPAQAAPERPDHIALELEFMAFLLTKKRLAGEGAADEEERAGRVEVCAGAERSFFRDHLAWWVPSFAAGLRRKAGGGFYRAVADLLAAWVPVERERFGVPPPRMPLQATLIERPEEQSGCAGCSS